MTTPEDQGPCVYCGAPGPHYPDKPSNPYWKVRREGFVCTALDCRADAELEVCCLTGCPWPRRLTIRRYLTEE